ncbi:hypothetical protein ACFQZE_02695 [Paenibacillus sp. GCM10027627]|uniref:hypothetical protein n=1 Tax=unclassified Paenibacillus TaxID=185978 RepID=UPI00363C1B44
MRFGRTVAIACSMTLAIMLVFLGVMKAIGEREPTGKEITVFRNEPISHLTSGNIVDVLSVVSLHERLGRAEWRGSVLAVDLLVMADKGRPEAWFQDIETLIGVSFRQLDNVKRLLIHIVENGESEQKLMAAVDIRSTDEWLAESGKEPRIANPVHDNLWRERLRLSFTTAWINRFGPPEGYSAQSTTGM